MKNILLLIALAIIATGSFFIIFRSTTNYYIILFSIVLYIYLISEISKYSLAVLNND